MASIGVAPLICPVCNRHLQVPMRSEGPAEPQPSGGYTLTLVLDHAFLRAHWLTHGPHGGLPVAA